jgi:hypothetical protein
MTLLLVLANQQQVVLLSDRRLTNNGHLVDIENELKDESNKAAVLVCRNARLTVAYTGLAKEETFVTKRWLPVALAESASPDFLMGPTIMRFRERATRDFARIPARTPSSKRFSVVLAGYCYDDTPPRCYCWLVSNYDGLDGPPPRDKPSDEFSAQFIYDNGAAEGFKLLLVLGAEHLVKVRNFKSLQTLLQENRPAQALVGKGVQVIRTAAEAAGTRHPIGKQCTSIVLPSDPYEQAIAEYHSAKVTHQSYWPSLISAIGDESGVYVIADPLVEARNANNQPRLIAVPKVGRNRPCPCGSGLKYKSCHGRARQN